MRPLLAGRLQHKEGPGDASPIGCEELAWALGALCQFHRVAFDEKLVLGQLAPPHDLSAVAQAAGLLGLDAAWKACPAARLNKLPAPFLALLHPAAEPPRAAGEDAAGNDSSSPNPGGPAPRLAFVLRVDAGRVAFVEYGARSHTIAPLAEFEARYAGSVLQARPKTAPPRDPDAAAASRPFGFGWFVPELLKHRKVFRDVLIASLAIQLMTLATPLFTQVVIDKVVVHHTLNTLAVIGIGLAVFMVFTAAMTWVRQYLILHTGNRIDAVLGLRVFEHLFRLPPRFFEQRPTGVLVARIHGVETIRDFLASAAVTLMLDLPFMLIFLAVMVWYSWELSLITLGVLAAIVGLSLAIAPLFRRRLNQQFLLGARNQAFLTEYISGLETVKSLQMEPQLNSRFGDYLASYLEAGFRTRTLANTYQVAANTLDQLLTLAILCAGAWMVMQEEGFTIGMLVAFQMLASRLSQPMLKLVGLWQEFQQAGIAVKRLGDVMNAPQEPYSVIPSRESRRRGAIQIDNLAFRYGENLPWLYRGLGLSVEPGQCIAIMGPSGCGKSTLARLLQGFYQPTEGAIRIDGHDIRHLSANELRACFGVVPQETVLFSGTIHDNVVLGNPHAGFEDVVFACKAAGIHDTIEALPQGYQTPIGEHGAGLSGGQKQRIAIARALLKRPPILIFDEATSNLDEETANAFGETINQLRGKATILMIAHKLPESIRDLQAIRLDGAGIAGTGRDDRS
ncbi:MAG TPA: peptidase domain-containing ABC transporter [Burkholderiales bacterium]|nr:peptidase domain-containing ABC transporter [Burkholderiales bacterium]